ncbi:hypothetical protein EJ06DRAFT_554718 [Trichodelitschia bisporula]|uniref:4'-phosphopantetheinyl transferase domain-containing protein n=1 Tax=Trichodelitschia bisporula TaxID=703511 RepID=A0A6G1I4J0_9PEZI|nr:hypothetical protein EJ06DRAFT_554718 [Trichodelitschia bisporula]
MPLRPFPVALRTGIDICSVARLQRVLCPTDTLTWREGLNARFVDKLLTPLERQAFWARVERLASLRQVAGYLAARWAAKEAIIKASTRKLGPLDIIVGMEGRRPFGVILDENMGEQEEGMAGDGDGLAAHDLSGLNGQVVQLSLSHEEEYAIAVCLVPDEPSCAPLSLSSLSSPAD